MALMDPAAHLPHRLQERLDSWNQSPPKWQHQAYGPLNAYFSLKFPPSHFLVKPQALLRGEAPQAVNDDDDDDSDVGNQSFSSIDSHGVMVTKERFYPDFDIDQYWGADDDTNKWPDIVRIVVEVASLKKYSNAKEAHSNAVVQLYDYLNTVGERWDERLIGIAILGKEAYLIHCTRENPQIREVYEVSGDDDDDGNDDTEIDGGEQNDYWMSLFDPRVVQVLDEIHTLSMHSEN